MNTTIRILGIDPGSRVTGYGVVDVTGSQCTYVASGCIRTQADSHIQRLAIIGTGIRQVLDQYAPTEAAIEQVFLSKNADSALKLGQARAAAICRILDDLAPEVIFEYSARSVKQATVGYGAADKIQMLHMVKQLLSLKGALSEDAADALAIAICHANSRRLKNKLKVALASKP